MKKLFKEFKAFINKGSVMDLAVGMIVGSAFTAIVTALVNNILKPLINWIPGANNTGALQTVLRQAVTDADGNIVTEALILDWGAVISAIITFLCTAVVLFAIVKSLNKMKETGNKVKNGAKNLVDKIGDEITQSLNKDTEKEEENKENAEVTDAENTESETNEAAEEKKAEEKTEITEVAATTDNKESNKVEELLTQILETLKSK